MFSISDLLIAYVDYRIPPLGPEKEKFFDRLNRRMQHPVYRWYDLVVSTKARWTAKTSFWISYAIAECWKGTLGRWIFAKKCRNGPAELAALRLVISKTSIPVPRPLFCIPLWFSSFHSHLLFMGRVPGIELESVWDTLSEDEQRHIITQLAAYIRELRTLVPPPGESIRSAAGGPINHPRVFWNGPLGPFPSEHQFNYQLRCGPNFEHEQCPTWILDVQEKRHPLVFTHADLAPRNIMVEGTTITAIVDWGSSGWYPAHMEYCLTKNWGWSEPWISWVDDIVEPYLEEARADKELLQRLWVPRFVCEE